MNTTTNTSKGVAVAKYLLLAVLVVGIGSVFYMYYRSSDSCRVMDSISNDPKLNKLLKEGLVEYLSLAKVQLFLQQSSGEVFSVADFGVPFPEVTVFERFGIENQNIQLVIETDSSDKSFRLPYNVKEIGIGYSRSYLIYVNNSGVRNEGVENIELNSNSYVDCRVHN